MKARTTTYSTQGSARGCCGHRHRTLRTAYRCMVNDDRAVRRGHGQSAYSDRGVIRSDGAPLTRREREVLSRLADEHIYGDELLDGEEVIYE